MFQIHFADLSERMPRMQGYSPSSAKEIGISGVSREKLPRPDALIGCGGVVLAADPSE